MNMASIHHPPRLLLEETVLVVIDVQQKLIDVFSHEDRVRLVREIGFLLDTANLLDVPTLATEQYPQGLGPTVPALSKRFPEPPPGKRAFSCVGCDAFLTRLRELNRPRVLLAGIEAHVCVLNTALDLLAEGKEVFLAIDAIGSRYAIDAEVAIRRMERAGVIPTTGETAAFEWLGSAEHPKFKEISKLVRARMEGQT